MPMMCNLSGGSPWEFAQLGGRIFRPSSHSVGRRRGHQGAHFTYGVSRVRAALAILEPFDRISIRSKGCAAIFESARGGVEARRADCGAWTPTEPTEDPNLFPKSICKVLPLGKTFGVWSRRVYLWVSRSAPNLPIQRDAPAHVPCCAVQVHE
jgi:hypothetical protein